MRRGLSKSMSRAVAGGLLLRARTITIVRTTSGNSPFGRKVPGCPASRDDGRAVPGHHHFLHGSASMERHPLPASLRFWLRS
jgi:hypothetical protein